jgi:hypothetical protein
MRRSSSTQHSFHQPGAAILAPSYVHGLHHAAQYPWVKIHPSTILPEPVVVRPSPIGSRNFRPIIGRSMSIVATCLVAGVVLGSALIAAVKLLLIAALIGVVAPLLCKRNHEHTVLV